MEHKDLSEIYTFISLLGEGGFGQVWKVKIKGSDDIRAVKLIKKLVHGGPKEKQYKSVLAEIKALKKLNNTHNSQFYIVKFYQFFVGINGPNEKPRPKGLNFGGPKTRGYYVIEMEYFEGMDLYQRVMNMKERGLPYAFNLSELCILVVHLIKAIDFIHKQKLAHRDIKPSNVMVRKGKVVLVDFGLACVFEECIGESGTPSYQGPEIKKCKGNRSCKIDWSKGDIYALGKTLQFLVMNSEGSTDIINELLWNMTDFDPKSRPSASEALKVMSSKGACARSAMTGYISSPFEDLPTQITEKIGAVNLDDTLDTDIKRSLFGSK